MMMTILIVLLTLPLILCGMFIAILATLINAAMEALDE